MRKFLILIFWSFCLAVCCGCVVTATDAKNSNEASFKSPEYVGEVNGKKIYHCEVWVKRGEQYNRQDLYFVGDTISTYDSLPKGRSEVSVMIDGVPFIPVQAEVSE